MTQRDYIRQKLATVLPQVNRAIIATHNLQAKIKTRETSIALTNLEQAELWLEKLINDTPETEIHPDDLQHYK